MATLLPSLSSEDEENHESSDDNEEEDEIDKSFQFGGILGEDGGLTPSTMPQTTGWSYQTAMNNIVSSSSDLLNNERPGSVIPRMDVAALIAAKRKSFQQQDEAAAAAKEKKSQKDDESSKSSSSTSSGSEDDSSSSSSTSDSSSSSDEDDNEAPLDDSSHHDLEEDVLKTRAGRADEDDDDSETDNSQEEEDEEDKREAAKAAAFFDDGPQQEPSQDIEVFAQLTLSRPILRGVAAMGFVKPTPIQAAVIPLALAGRDICASAVTGSGKTAAFLLPLLERMLHRGYGGRTKAIILSPTRELAAQCLGMMTTLAQFTKLRAALIVGGAKNINAQAAELRTRPDLVVATPGRLLDHMTNSPGVVLETGVEFLVLDEADRLLDMGFQDEVHEIVKQCPVQRQTMLFSATMNTKVDDLIHLSLKHPIRVRASDNEKKKKNSTKDVEVAPRLEQEFVRIRAGNEGKNREGMLLALLTRTFTKQTIVFFDTKAAAHRLMILCGLCGIKCAELHGNLTQQQRLQALEDFRNGEVDILLATDLAARGLDIERVRTVINFEMPCQIETYIHRIGRTARAGRGGQSCTLVGEGRRHLMKELIKDAESKKNSKRSKNGKTKKTGSSFETGVIRSRAIPPAVVAHFAAKINELEPHVEEVLQAEAVARLDRLAEMEAIKAQNIIEHAEEIKSRPQREWFASNKQKKLSKQAAAEKKKLIAEKAGTGTHKMTRKKRRAREAMQAFNNAAHNNNDNSEDDDTPAARPAVNIKSAVRQKKRKDEAKEREAASKTIGDIDEERAKRKRKAPPTGADAVGDGRLFDEDKVAFAARRRTTTKRGEETVVAKSSFSFREFDPSKKLGKKKGVKSFKSKSKYKRR